MKNTLTITEHEEIIVDDVRDIEKRTISKKDKELLFSIIHTDRLNKERYVFSRKGRDGIKANSIVGSISLKNGLIVEILPKFAKNDLTDTSIKKYRKTLLNMIRVSNEKNFISSTTQSSKVSMAEMPLIHYIIELFSESLLSSLRNGVFSTYNKTIEKSSNIRGKILVSKSIQNSLIDKSKVYISYNKHSSNNLLMKIFRTLAQMLLNDKNLSYKAKQNLYEIYLLLDGVNIIHLKKHDFDKIIFNRLNDKFEVLFTQAEFIFNQYMPYSSSINSSPFWAILFDMDYLFEKFCAYLFRKSDIEIEEQSMIKCFTNDHKTVSAKPDFIIQNNISLFDSKITNVVDAKWKLLSKKKSLYGLDAQNFWQLFSYMNLVHTEEINGYFIVPKSNDTFDDIITFKPIKENHKFITILSIDFSLEFDELVNKYNFEIINNELKLQVRVIKQEIEIKEPLDEKAKEKIIVQEEENKFNFKEFIDELEMLHIKENKKLLKYISSNFTRYHEKCKNIFILKEIQDVEKKNFIRFVERNILVNSLSMDNLNLKEIPNNIYKFRNLEILDLSQNHINKLPNNFFKLKKLKELNLSKNLFIELSEEIRKLRQIKKINVSGNKNIVLPFDLMDIKSLEKIILDKSIIQNNLRVLIKLKLQNIFICDNNKSSFSEYIDSLFLENYLKISDDDKVNFCIESDFKQVDYKLIKKLCYEENEDILVEILFNKTIDIRFVMLIYILNFKNRKLKEDYIFKAITEINHETLNEILHLTEKESTYDVAKYIENNFSKIDNEVIFGYSMSNIDAMSRMREMISKLTNNLDILDELSKNKDDDRVLGNIIFKGKDNRDFTEKIKDGNTIYSIKTLNRIAKYEQYYEYENKKCRIAQVAGNYSLSNKTREYLFNKYKNDEVILEELNNKSLYHCHPELKIEIENTLGILDRDRGN